MVGEGILLVNSVTQYDVAHFVRNDRRQCSFIRKCIQEPTAYYDGTTNGEAFHWLSQQNATADLRHDLEIVGNFQVLNHRIKHLVDLALRRQQGRPLHPIKDVVFRLAFPSTLGLDGRHILLGIALILNLVGRFHNNIGKLTVPVGTDHVIAP